MLGKKHHGHDAELLLFIAHAHFSDGRHRDALKSLSKALHIDPSDCRLWLNVASVEYEFAAFIFNREQSIASDMVMADMEAARDYVTTALKILNWLLERKKAMDGDKKRRDGRLEVI